jgi:SAM-dependent methyltransferase
LTAPLHCPVCAGQSFSPARHIESRVDTVPQGLTRPPAIEVDIAQCRGCGLEINAAFLTGRDPNRLYTDDQIYSAGDYAYQRELYPKYTVDLVRELARARPERGRLLEVGFLDTDLLARLAGDGWQVAGVELDGRAVDRARAAGFDVRRASIDHPALDGEQYDAVVAVGVLEHVADPRRFLRRLGELLAPGGVALLQLPNLGSLNARVSAASHHGWDMYGEPGHLFHFRRRHLAALVDAAGLELERYRTSTIRVRGKLPLVPFRAPRLEPRVAALIHTSRLARALYTGALAALDLIRLGDTHVVVARRPVEPA